MLWDEPAFLPPMRRPRSPAPSLCREPGCGAAPRLPANTSPGIQTPCSTLACQRVPWHRLKTTNCPRGDGPSSPDHRGSSWSPALDAARAGSVCHHLSRRQELALPGCRWVLHLPGAAGSCWGCQGMDVPQGKAACPGNWTHPGFLGRHCPARGEFPLLRPKRRCPYCWGRIAGWQQERHSWSQIRNFVFPPLQPP